MPPTILLADDHEDNRIALITILERRGYRVLGAGDGAEAVEMALGETPDLVLMDLAMPVLNGVEAMKRIKADERTAGVPIVALTAMALSVDEEKLRAEGFDGLLIKPCMPPQLIAEVERLVGPAE
jgi:two-component system, cell cycle response regulator DivK